MRDKIRAQLLQLAEPDYKAFQEKLLPGVTDLLGVRVPKLREIAKKTAKSGAFEYLSQMQDLDWQDDGCYEEKLLYGMVIGYAKMNDSERRQYLEAFVPVIDSWGVCDSCCVTYRWMKKQPAYWWDYLNRWILTDTEYGIRFGIVSMLDHFVDQTYIEEIFHVCSQIRNEGYYARMAVAWLISVCFVRFPEKTCAFLEKGTLDGFTHNKSIQKTCESDRVSKEWKASARKLRREEQK